MSEDMRMLIVPDAAVVAAENARYAATVADQTTVVSIARPVVVAELERFADALEISSPPSLADGDLREAVMLLRSRAAVLRSASSSEGQVF